MNKNSKHKANILRAKAIEGARGGQSFTAAYRDAIEGGRSRTPVTMYFTSKWESNNSFRMYGI